MTDQITSLLQKISLYDKKSNHDISSNQSESENSKKLTMSNVDENYFHIKLRRLFGSTVESSFSHVEIELTKFFQDVQTFLDWVVEQKGLDVLKSNKQANKKTPILFTNHKACMD